MEFISKLHVQEQKTSLGDDETVEGAFQARQKRKHQGKGYKNNGSEKGKAAEIPKNYRRRNKFPPCNICQRINHLKKD